MSELLLLVFPVVAFYALTAGIHFGQFSAISLFVYANATMAAGTVPSLDPSIAADHVHALLVSLTLLTIVGTAFVASVTQRRASRASFRPSLEFSLPQPSVALWIVISIAITALYYVNVGYLAFFESLRALAGSTDTDFAALRLESYAGSRYFFPGYVNQFKNALLPALTIAVLVSAHHLRARGRVMTTALLLPIALLALLGTGQRGAFVLALGVAVVAASLIAPGSFRRNAFRIGLLGLGLFFVTTIASGRATTALRTAEGIGGQIGVLFDQLAFRLLGSNQLSSVVGFRYVHETDVPFASEWAASIIGLLPGLPGSDLSNRIFAMLYGSSRGTAPLSLWGSAYHNVGMPGAVVLAAVIAIALCAIATKINATANSNLIELVGMAGVTVTLGTWIADGPVAPINAGLAVYVLLWLWGSRLARGPRAAATRRPMRRSMSVSRRLDE